MNLLFTYNVRHVKPSLDDKQALAEAEFDEPKTIQGIKCALQKLGHQVFAVEADAEAYLKFKRLKFKIDLAFNIAEGIYGNDREAQIPAMLEMLQIPYVGSNPLAQALCLNKAKTKEILQFHQIPTAHFQLFANVNEKLQKNLKFPLIVKPNAEGSSKGISQSSFVKNEQALYREVKKIITELKQSALAEEFLSGREFTVALIGNGKETEVLPPVEVDFSALPEGLVPFDSYEVKWLVDSPGSQIQTVICPAPVSAKLLAQIQTVCLKTKAVLGVLDWCRIDLRLDQKEIPHIIEINQTPGIMPDPEENSRFPLSARTAGYNYEIMLQKILTAACRRYNLKYF